MRRQRSGPAASRSPRASTSRRSPRVGADHDRDRRRGAASAGSAPADSGTARAPLPHAQASADASHDAGPVLRPDRRRRGAVVEDLSRELVAPRARGLRSRRCASRGEPAGARGRGVAVHPLRSTQLPRHPRSPATPSAATRPRARTRETVRDLRRVLRRERPAVVHAHNWLVHSYLPLDRAVRRRPRPLAARLRPDLRDQAAAAQGGVCSGPAPVKCLRCAGEHYGADKGLVAAVGTRLSRAAAAPPRRRLPAGQLGRRGALPDRATDEPPG